MVKIKVIYGAPASGKTTYAKQQMNDNDLIYDFDDIMMCLSGLPYQTVNQHLVQYVLDIRNSIISKLREEKQLKAAYIITTFIGKDLKERLSGLDIEYIRMDTTISECIKRVRDSDRKDKQTVIQTIKEWYYKYPDKTLADKYRTKEQKRKFYDSGQWKRLREEVKQRDNHECQMCKRKGLVRIDTNSYSESAKRKKIELVVHHIQELEHHPDLALDKDNLETVCVDCHNKEHGRYFERKADQWEDERW